MLPLFIKCRLFFTSTIFCLMCRKWPLLATFCCSESAFTSTSASICSLILTAVQKFCCKFSIFSFSFKILFYFLEFHSSLSLLLNYIVALGRYRSFFLSKTLYFKTCFTFPLVQSMSLISLIYSVVNFSIVIASIWKIYFPSAFFFSRNWSRKNLAIIYIYIHTRLNW